jgi:transposase-like protein
MAMGRPTKYKPEFAEQAEKLCNVMAATDAELAAYFGCALSTLHVWKLQYPKFAAALAAGKGPANDRVAKSLYDRAMGYSVTETDVRVVQGKIVKTDVVKHYPPDVVAMIFWLKNRDSSKWSDKSEVDLNVKDNLADKLAEARARIKKLKDGGKAKA